MEEKLKKNAVSGLMLTLLVVGLFGAVVQEAVNANPTFIVTPTSNYITVENDYYKVKLTKRVGTITELYIKPYTSLNIVAHESGFNSLGGHEESNWYNSTYSKDAGNWIGYSIQSSSLSIVEQTSEFVTIRVYVDFGGYNAQTGYYYVEMGLVEYYTFYANSPYYLVTYSKIYQENLFQPYNPQVCFLFSMSWWNGQSVLRTKSRTVNATGGVRNGTALFDVYFNQAKTYGKFPWYFVFNSTTSTSYGIIMLDANPTSAETTLGGEFASSSYTEFQIDHNWGGEVEDQWNSVTYLAIANATASWTAIDELATNLFQSSLEPEVIQNYPLGVKSNNRIDGSYAGYGAIGRCLSVAEWYAEPSADYGIGWSLVNGVRNHLRYTNATGTYAGIYSISNLTITINTRNNTYASQSFWGYWDNKFKWNYTAQVWSKSDTQAFTASIEAINPVNVTDLWYMHYAHLHTTRVTNASYPSLVKYKTTQANRFTEEGWFIKNVTNKRTDDIVGWSSFWMQDNTGDILYPSGTKWSTTVYVQPFRIYTWQTGKTQFPFSDYHDPDDNWIDWSWNVHYWLPTPLLNQEGNLTVLSGDDFNCTALGYTSWSNNALTIHSLGDSGKTSNLQVYVGDKGEPVTVTGASSWAYDDSTKIVTITKLHSSEQEIILDWTSLVEVTIVKPQNITYTTTTIPVEITASGGTIDTVWYNCWNGSWIYPTNQTSTSPTSMTGFISGTYQFYAWANNTGGNSDSKNVWFTIAIPPPPVPEFPLGSAMYIAAIPLLFYLWWKRKQRTLH